MIKKNSNPQTHNHQTPNISVADVLDRVHIAEIISEVVELTMKGDNLTGLCPMHDDTSPSFNITLNPSIGGGGLYRCWSCSAGLNGSPGGDVLTFIQRYYDMSFKEALSFLAAKSGLISQNDLSPSLINHNPSQPIQSYRQTSAVKNEQSNAAQQEPVNTEPMYETVQKCSTLYQEALGKSTEAQEYLFVERGLNKDIAQKYLLGYAPDSFCFLKDFFNDYDTNAILINTGMVRENKPNKKANNPPQKTRRQNNRYDFFRNRLMFALRDEDGKVVGFGGRNLGPETIPGKTKIRVAKYINSPQNEIYDKSNLVYGLFEAKESIKNNSYALITEGYMDVISLANHGITNAISCMGTSVTAEQIQKVFNYTDNIIFAFDGDKAGLEASLRALNTALPITDENKTIKFLILSENKDPDDFIKKYGSQAFLASLQDALDIESFFLYSLRKIYTDEKGGINKKNMSAHASSIINQSSNLPDLRERLIKAISDANLLENRLSSTRYKQSNSITDEPSVRLFAAAKKHPDAAIKILDDLQTNISNMPQPMQNIGNNWLEHFLASSKTKFSTKLDDTQKQYYETILKSACTVLQQFCELKYKDLVLKQKQSGEINDMEYLEKIVSIKPRLRC